MADRDRKPLTAGTTDSATWNRPEPGWHYSVGSGINVILPAPPAAAGAGRRHHCDICGSGTCTTGAMATVLAKNDA